MSGVVIHLEEGAGARPALTELARRPHLTLAEPTVATKVPAVLEARSAAEGRDLARAVEETNGVVRVDVVFVAVDPDSGGE